MSQQLPWPLDGNADELYERHLVPAMFGPWAEDLVALAAPRPGSPSSTSPAEVVSLPVSWLNELDQPAPW